MLAILEKATLNCESLLHKPAPRVYLIGLEEEGLRFQVEAWTLNNPQELSSVRSKLNIQLVTALKTSGKDLNKIRLVQPTVVVSLTAAGNQRVK
jgi:small-conductance mechanosensitive channel